MCCASLHHALRDALVAHAALGELRADAARLPVEREGHRAGEVLVATQALLVAVAEGPVAVVARGALQVGGGRVAALRVGHVDDDARGRVERTAVPPVLLAVVAVLGELARTGVGRLERQLVDEDDARGSRGGGRHRLGHATGGRDGLRGDRRERGRRHRGGRDRRRGRRGGRRRERRQLLGFRKRRHGDLRDGRSRRLRRGAGERREEQRGTGGECGRASKAPGRHAPTSMPALCPGANPRRSPNPNQQGCQGSRSSPHGQDERESRRPKQARAAQGASARPDHHVGITAGPGRRVPPLHAAHGTE